jgi:hypothetical protein
LAIEARVDDAIRLCPDPTLTFSNWEALCRAIEQHEAFRQQVSDVVYKSLTSIVKGCAADAAGDLSRFIIPKPKPDPLVEVLEEISGEGGFDNFDHYAYNLHAALDARGWEIREKDA